MKLKSTQYQLVDDILMKRNFGNRIWKHYIQASAIRHRASHKNTNPREKNAKPLHFVTIEHPSKSRKLNGVSKIFLELVHLYKYNLITAIHFMIDDVRASQYFQTNGSKMFGVPYCLTLKLHYNYSNDRFLPNIQKMIIEHNEDWHDKVTYQTSLGTFSFSLVYNKKLIFSLNIYLLSFLLDQFYPGKYFSIQYQIKKLLKMENIRTDHKVDIHLYAPDII